MKIFMAHCTGCADAPSMPFANSAARDAWSHHHTGASGHTVEKAEVIVDTRPMAQVLHEAVANTVFDGVPEKIEPYTEDRWRLSETQALVLVQMILAEMRK